MTGGHVAERTGGYGVATPRLEARSKVTGQARYGSDFDGGREPAHARLVTSGIALGRITGIEEAAARAVPGVLEILTWRNAGPATLALADGALCGPGDTREALDEAIQRAAIGAIEAYAETAPYGAPPDAIRRLHSGRPVYVGGPLPDRIQWAFGANFAEVCIHALTSEIRVSRLVGAYAAGRIINPLTAKSQLMGGQIWGMSAALHEATDIDARTARYTDADLAGYLIPVNADVTEVESIFVPEDDSLVNELGVKGLGELGNVGTNAAVANAVYHATGVRVRDLPTRLEDLFHA
jgi:xanthine dehydrogenase YagR molybdenum-binding subunit